jgi:hypothetical protein
MKKLKNFLNISQWTKITMPCLVFGLAFCFLFLPSITLAAPTSCSGTIKAVDGMAYAWATANEDLIPACIQNGDISGLGYTLKMTSGTAFGNDYVLTQTVATTDKLYSSFDDTIALNDTFDLYLNGEQLPVGAPPPVGGGTMPAATSTLATIMAVVGQTSVDTTTNVFQNYFGYICIIMLLGGLIVYFKRFVFVGAK